MTASLTPALALDFITALSADIRAAAVLDARGDPLAGPPALAEAARALAGVEDAAGGGGAAGAGEPAAGGAPDRGGAGVGDDAQGRNGFLEGSDARGRCSSRVTSGT